MTKPVARRTSIWFIAYALGPMVVALASRRPMVDNSFLWHITAGDIQRNDGRVITEDPFSFLTLGEPWRTQSWLADVWYSWGVARFGIEAGQFIAPLVAVFLFLVLACLVTITTRTGPATAYLMAFSTLTLLPYMQPRPVILSYLVFGLVVLASQRPQLMWAIPLLCWMWASVHGSFFLCFVFLGTEWFRTRRADLVKAAMGALVLASLTAHGPMIWTILAEFLGGREALGIISEWQTPSLLDLMFLPISLSLVAIMVHLTRTGLTLRVGLPLLAWVAFGITAKRSMPLLWLVLVPLATAAFVELTSGWRFTATLPRVPLIVICLAMVALPFAQPAEEALDRNRFPLDAAEELTADRVFHDDVTGGYLIYAYWPERLVYVDDRAELYGDRLVTFADAKAGGSAWSDVLRDASINQALVRKEDAIAAIMRESADWILEYEDEGFAVFTRLDPIS